MRRFGVALAIAGAGILGGVVGARAQSASPTTTIVATAIVGYGQITYVRAQSATTTADVCLAVYESPSLGTASVTEVTQYGLCW